MARAATVEVESTPVVVAAVAIGLALAAAAVATGGRRHRLMLVIALVALTWAALDIREIIHQVDESQAGIAAVVGLLHATAAALTARLARNRAPA